MYPVHPQVQLLPIPPVKPKPNNTYTDQFDIYTALQKGTLFRWLYDPYVQKC